MPSQSKKMSLNLAGGGPIGAIYELGALMALEDNIEGLDLTKLDIYVGISAGSFLAACLSNGISVKEMYNIFILNEDISVSFKPEYFMKPALKEYSSRIKAIPKSFFKLLGLIFKDKDPLTNSNVSFFEYLTKIGSNLPSGLLNNNNIDLFMKDLFLKKGATNDFKCLKNELIIVATNLDSGEIARFGGSPDLNNVPISKAIQASSALPGLFPPVEINGDHYVDGALVKTMHASASLYRGAQLAFCINPIVPINLKKLKEEHKKEYEKMIHGGFPMILSQSLRAILHTRMKNSHYYYQHKYPDRDVLLFEPEENDTLMFFSNVFSYSDRKLICQHAYSTITKQLYQNKENINAILSKYNLKLK